MPEDWKYYRGLDARTENGWWQYELQFKDPDWAVGKEKWQFGGWVTYGQRTAWHVANTEDASVDVLFDIPPGLVVSGESRRMGDYAVFVVQISAYEEKLSYYEYMPCGETRVYWCDGEIIYMLACPAWMEEDQILELMDSLYPVEDPFKR